MSNKVHSRKNQEMDGRNFNSIVPLHTETEFKNKLDDNYPLIMLIPTDQVCNY
jgi:hypothetical protein